MSRAVVATQDLFRPVQRRERLRLSILPRADFAVSSSTTTVRPAAPATFQSRVQDYDSKRILVAVENAAGRRVDLVNKDGSGFSTYVSNTTALSAVLRGARFLSDGSLLVSKSSAIEKFAAGTGVRVVKTGPLPYVNAPAGSCSASATLISGIDTLSNGKIIFTHASAAPNNRLNLVSSSGYTSAADCLAGTAITPTTALPTAVIVHSSGKVLVATGSTTAGSNLIQTYPVNATTNAIGAATTSFADESIVNGPTAMVEEPVTTDVFVANGSGSTIERFKYDSTTSLMTQIPSLRISDFAYTRCVSAMKVIKE